MDISIAATEEGVFEEIGLSHSPFPVTPDASHYFCPLRLEKHIFELLHCIHVRKGFMLFTADVGLGKSTLSRYLIASLEADKIDIALVFNTFLQGLELLKTINQDLGIVVEGGIKVQLDAFNAFLLEGYESERNCLIIIDDAQNLTIESLELIRQISNLEVSRHKLVQILLIAQPEIMASINSPQIRQLKSRIALHIELAPFSLLEVKQYVEFRLTSAVNNRGICLTHRALKALYKDSKGYPRRINLVMDRALYALLIRQTKEVNLKVIQLAINDLNKAIGGRSKEPAARLGAILFLVVGLAWVAGLVVSDFNIDTFIQPTTQLAKVQEESIVVRPIESVKAAKSAVEITQPTRPGLLAWLQKNGFESQLGAVNTTLDSNDFTSLKRLFAETPLRLLVSDKPLAQVEDEGYLFKDGLDRKHYLYFWKPSIDVKAFYFGMHTHQIGELQRLLAQKGFFHSPIDSVVGSKTIYAIVGFQRAMNLLPTGQLDWLTLYYLTH